MSARPAAEARLAIHGGRPVREALLPYGRQTVADEDIAAVTDVLRSDWITTGPKVGEFEGAIAERVGARYAVAYSSGTSALHGAARAAGITAGVEGITTPLTFCATSNALLYEGGTPVFVDVDRSSLTIDPDRVSAAITTRTRAILPVDYAGAPADLEPLVRLADRHGLTIIEDASHALGATYRGQRVGGISHMTVFSFHPVKHLTTGEGGMVTTNDPALADRLRRFRTHGIERGLPEYEKDGGWFYAMVELGYNYRISDIGCALGLAQVPRLEANLARRRAIAARYDEAFADLAGVTLPRPLAHTESAWHLYPVRITPPVERRAVYDALRAEGIGVNVHYIPVHLHPYYRERFGFSGGEFPAAEAAYRELVSLPMFHGMSDTDVEDVVTAVRKVMRYFEGARG